MPILTNASQWTVTTKKHPLGYSGFTWVNKYYIAKFGGTMTNSDFPDIAELFRNFEVPMHNEITVLESVTVSTYPEESIDSTDRFKSFVTVDFNTTCTRDQPGDALDARYVLNVKLKTDVGRSGLKQYRGLLGEGDITTSQALNGFLPDNARNSFQLSFDNLFTILSTELQGIEPTLGVTVISISSPDVYIYRPVTAMNVSKPSFRQTNNAWFNRTV